jgi:sulfatase maturation enzyme AslB (radical SAM superfamily)
MPAALFNDLQKPFSLLIKPTSADCNLNCRYCFYKSKSALYPDTPVHRMSYATLGNVIGSYMSTIQPQYGYSWQGGEPLLMGLDFFEKADVLSLTGCRQVFGATSSAGSSISGIRGMLVVSR